MAHKRSYAAYAREDIEDAKRGAPAVSLEAWAQARGIPFKGSDLAGQLITFLPTWADYQFNVCRGDLAGRFGQVAHELEEISVDDAGDLSRGGGFWSVRIHGKSKGLLSLVGIDKAPPNEPFAAHAAWIPTTRVVLRVPEIALLPRMVIRTSDTLPFIGNPKLDDHGLPGFRMAGSEWVDDDLRAAVSAAARPLGSIDATFRSMEVSVGLLTVHRNGFVADEVALDALVAAATAIATSLVEVARPLTAPQPFTEPLPAPDAASRPPGYVSPQPHELDAFGRLAAELGMLQEDPTSLHRSQPRCPVPGVALGLLRGTPPGAASEARVGVFVQAGRTWGTYRTAVMAPAREGAATPLGGHRHEPTDMYVEVVDGVAYAWPRVRTPGGFNSAVTVPAAITTLRELGLADL